LTSSVPGVPRGLLLRGSQEPRVRSVPPRVSCLLGDEAVELAASTGLTLDPWQEWILRESMGTLDHDRWAAFEVGLLIPRQNGKNEVLLARELAGLFLLDERLLIHTAHEFKTCAEHFLRARAVIESSRDLARELRKVVTSHGDEALELRSGQRLRFLARSRTSARGFTADFLAYDEAMVLSDETVGASMPTLSASDNPQVWYTASEGRRDAFHLARLRRRGLAGGDPSLMWAEWSADLCHEMCPPGCGEHDDPADRGAWAKANPALGYRISEDHVAREHASMSGEQFAAARLAVAAWPADENGWGVITELAWDACADEAEDPLRPEQGLVIAADVTPAQSAGAIAIAGARADGKVMAEIPAGCHGPGTSWMVPRLVELRDRYRPRAIIIDRPPSSASPLVDEAERAGLTVTSPSAAEVGQAFAMFCVQVADRRLVHLGVRQPELRAALAGASRRDIGDGGHAWSRKDTPHLDISPLVAVTLAVWGYGKFSRRYDVLKSVM
jgi:hypothetical protein